MLLSEEVQTSIDFKVEEFGGVRNQYTIRLGGNVYFQSYNSIIIMRNSKGQVFLDKNKWDYSRTTSKYRNKWLGFGTDEIKLRIKHGNIKLIDLNK